MQLVPLQPVASQIVSCTLGGQSTTFNIYQKSTGMFIDVLVNGIAIITGVICQNGTVIVRDAYLGFVGDVAFFDTQGATDPVYTGLGSRYIFLYFAPSELTGVA